MIDPKMLELSVYEGIPHLLTPVVTDPKKAVIALKWAVREMEERYKKMSRLGVRNIDGYNARVAEARARGETITRIVQTGFDKETGRMAEEEEVMDLSALPYIVVIVDEMADLMMVAGKDIEGAIQRARPDGPRRRHPSDHGDAAALGGRHHRHHQGELPDPHLLPGDQRRSTRAPSSASRARSSCSARATCSTWPAAGASRASTARSSPTRRSSAWSSI